MTRIGGAAILLLLAASEAFACHVPSIRTLDNQTVSGVMMARSGKPCSILLRRTIGPMYTAHVVERAAYGSVSVGAGNRVTYLSRPGYVGSDAFTYARTGANMQNQKVVRTVRVHVRVRP